MKFTVGGTTARAVVMVEAETRHGQDALATVDRMVARERQEEGGELARFDTVAEARVAAREVTGG